MIRESSRSDIFLRVKYQLETERRISGEFRHCLSDSDNSEWGITWEERQYRVILWISRIFIEIETIERAFLCKTFASTRRRFISQLVAGEIAFEWFYIAIFCRHVNRTQHSCRIKRSERIKLEIVHKCFIFSLMAATMLSFSDRYFAHYSRSRWIGYEPLGLESIL